MCIGLEITAFCFSVCTCHYANWATYNMSGYGTQKEFDFVNAAQKVPT